MSALDSELFSTGLLIWDKHLGKNIFTNTSTRAEFDSRSACYCPGYIVSNIAQL